MESVLGRVVVMIVVGIIGGTVAILFVRAESEQREASSSAGTGGNSLEQALDDQLLDNRTLSRENDKMDEVPEVLEAASRADNDIAHLRQQLPQKNIQSERRIMTPTQRADDVLTDGGFLDELLLAIRRKLLSLPEDESGEEMEEQNLRREKRYDIDARPEDDEWNELAKKDSYDPEATEGFGSGGGSWQRSVTRHHHIRHSRRKNHHRRYKTTTPVGVYQPVEREGEIGASAKLAVNSESFRNAIVNEKPSTGDSVTGANRVNRQFDNLTNVIIMGNITHIRSPHDIIEDDNLMAAEIREALLLAVPLSLLMTVLLLICVAFCCCRYRNHPAYSEHMAYASYREDEDYEQECPTVSTGMCDFCLPDISYQAHLATKIKKSKRRRGSDQIELVLGSDTMDCDPRDEGLKCHPPLYTLLSNLPPGSSLLEEDFRSESPFDSFRPSLPRRSQSLEYLTV
ncbi:uncharacterized protein [Palaemon carinicauda]|uniref:uncharacterized protein isoform X2 n=1 Tax=Palaemon carinicauda TaxID=392227 RepID=UPI0035B67E79